MTAAPADRKRQAVRLATVVLAAFSAAAAGDSRQPADGWLAFAGTWSVSGRRQSAAIEGGGLAAVVEVSGAVVLTNSSGLDRGFRGEAIGFDDGQGSSVGRCVWTDRHGDRIFSRLKGEPLQTGKRFEGTITGGTGRYEGLEGEYAFTWQYVVAAGDGVGGEAGVIQGRAVGLEGRVRHAAATR